MIIIIVTTTTTVNTDTLVGALVIFVKCYCRVLLCDYRVDERPFTETTRELDYGVLQFVDVTGNEAGEYICTAANSVGTSTVTVELSVRGTQQLTVMSSSSSLTRSRRGP